ncbi:CPBP family intramembrane glutamic endopeptidase [Paenibacillus agricola]|uniref:CPBP family intramembrane metalloprotease n=1 Tax=Paenibacillus agricola TaxID=2716264 RepID=A0ABX0J6F6_9BACL|nr:CPBP family intramembrane glutamic endopeptidase [Paenibacillus agricola]NHN31356.1 CPBP family intramembrane metalloprotease [Paenibacillus agricola]
MRKEYIGILVIFFLFAGPGPSVFFLNKFTVTILPLACFIAIFYLLRKEIFNADYNMMIKNTNYKLVFNSLKYCIFAHAIVALIFKPATLLADDLLTMYLIMPINIVLFGPIIEEIVYRKIIFGSLNHKFTFPIAAIASSAMFGIAHMSLKLFLAYFVVGYILCHLYKKTNTLYAPIIVHTLLNLIPILFKTLKG